MRVPRPPERHDAGLRTVASIEAVKGLLVIVVGLGLMSFVGRDVEEVAEHLVRHLHLNPARHYPHIFLEAAGRVSDRELLALAALALAYAGLQSLRDFLSRPREVPKQAQSRRVVQPRLAAWASGATPSGPVLGPHPSGRGTQGRCAALPCLARRPAWPAQCALLSTLGYPGAGAIESLSGSWLAEAYGLWRRRTWAQWLAALSGAIYLPFELYDLSRGITVLRLFVFIVNLGIVAYMALVLLDMRRRR